MGFPIKFKIKHILKLCGIGLISYFVYIYVFYFHMGPNDYATLVRVMPISFSKVYLDTLFTNLNKDVMYAPLIGSMDAIQNSLISNDNFHEDFDFYRLLPLLNDKIYYEPIPALACNLLLLNNDLTVFKAMSKKNGEDKISWGRCVTGGMVRVKEVWPNRYEAIRKNFKSMGS